MFSLSACLCENAVKYVIQMMLLSATVRKMQLRSGGCSGHLRRKQGVNESDWTAASSQTCNTATSHEQRGDFVMYFVITRAVRTGTLSGNS